MFKKIIKNENIKILKKLRKIIIYLIIIEKKL